MFGNLNELIERTDCKNHAGPDSVICNNHRCKGLLHLLESGPLSEWRIFVNKSCMIVSYALKIIIAKIFYMIFTWDVSYLNLSLGCTQVCMDHFQFHLLFTVTLLLTLLSDLWILPQQWIFKKQFIITTRLFSSLLSNCSQHPFWI